MDSLKCTVHKYLGRKVNVKSLIGNILAVDVGIKPAYLLDFGVTDLSRLTNLLETLRSDQIIKNQLKVVEMGLDCVIVTGDELEKLALSHLQALFIDVSKSVGKPKTVTQKSKVSRLMLELEAIVQSVRDTQEPLLNYVYTEDCNVTSLYGALLNYPVIYWYSIDDEECKNCLACETLTVVKVEAKIDVKDKTARKDHISEVSECSSEAKVNVDVNDTKIELIDLFGDDSVHTLYQFSYPTALDQQCVPVVHKWLDNMKEKINHSGIFKDPIVTMTQENLDAVML